MQPQVKFQHQFHFSKTFNTCFLWTSKFAFNIRCCQKWFLLGRYFKQSHRNLQYGVNNLATEFLSTCYSNWLLVDSFLKTELRKQDPDRWNRISWYLEAAFTHAIKVFLRYHFPILGVFSRYETINVHPTIQPNILFVSWQGRPNLQWCL